VLASSADAAWLTIKQQQISIYDDIYDEHLFLLAVGLSYYFVLSLFPLLVSMASLLGYVPIPHFLGGLLDSMARLLPGYSYWGIAVLAWGSFRCGMSAYQ
jgi:uncharacterized BrkB/YihY/UPF0761 family membrane protein